MRSNDVQDEAYNFISTPMTPDPEPLGMVDTKAYVKACTIAASAQRLNAKLLVAVPIAFVAGLLIGGALCLIFL